MKNVTLAMEDKLLEDARALARERGTTLNALVRSMLAHEVEQGARIAAARKGLTALMERSTLEFEPGTNVKELSRRYESDELSRHQHPHLGGGEKTD